MPSKIKYRPTLPILTESPDSLSYPHKLPKVQSEKDDLKKDPYLNQCNEGGCGSPSSSNLEESPCEVDPLSKNRTDSASESSPSKVLSISHLDTAVDSRAAKYILGDITEVKGVIFDMDGTLTIPVLRFADMKSKIGLKPTDDILPTVQKLPPVEREKALRIIEEFEEEGVNRMKLQPGVLEILHYLSERNIKRALVTRNARLPTDAFLKKLDELLCANSIKYPNLAAGCVFSEIITREFEPCKPHPASVYHICKQWSLDPKEVMFVGDDKVDMICGLRAGVGVNVILRNERNAKQDDYSHFSVDTLNEIISLISSLMTVPYKEVPVC